MHGRVGAPPRQSGDLMVLLMLPTNEQSGVLPHALLRQGPPGIIPGVVQTKDGNGPRVIPEVGAWPLPWKRGTHQYIFDPLKEVYIGQTPVKGQVRWQCLRQGINRAVLYAQIAPDVDHR